MKENLLICTIKSSEENNITALSLPPNTQVPLTMVNRRELPQSCLSNKLSKLTLATFDEDGM